MGRSTTPLDASARLVELVKRPQLTLSLLAEIIPQLRKRIDRISDRREETAEAVEVMIKYEGYIKREADLAAKTLRLDGVRLPEAFDYEAVKSLSTEARQKLSRIRPATIGQASRIPGVSPADVSILLLLLGR